MAAAAFRSAAGGSRLLLRPAPRLADGRAWAKLHHDLLGLDAKFFHVEHLHGLIGRPDLEGKPRARIGRDMLCNLVEDRQEPPGLHVFGVFGRSGQVFHLQDCLAPGVGITAAIERDERAGFYFGYVVAGLDSPAGIDDHQLAFRVRSQGIEDRAKRRVTLKVARER